MTEQKQSVFPVPKPLLVFLIVCFIIWITNLYRCAYRSSLEGIIETEKERRETYRKTGKWPD